MELVDIYVGQFTMKEYNELKMRDSLLQQQSVNIYY